MPLTSPQAHDFWLSGDGGGRQHLLRFHTHLGRLPQPPGARLFGPKGQGAGKPNEAYDNLKVNLATARVSYKSFAPFWGSGGKASGPWGVVCLPCHPSPLPKGPQGPKGNMSSACGGAPTEQRAMAQTPGGCRPTPGPEEGGWVATSGGHGRWTGAADEISGLGSGRGAPAVGCNNNK